MKRGNKSVKPILAKSISGHSAESPFWRFICGGIKSVTSNYMKFNLVGDGLVIFLALNFFPPHWFVVLCSLLKLNINESSFLERLVVFVLSAVFVFLCFLFGCWIEREREKDRK